MTCLSMNSATYLILSVITRVICTLMLPAGCCRHMRFWMLSKYTITTRHVLILCSENMVNADMGLFFSCNTYLVFYDSILQSFSTLGCFYIQMVFESIATLWPSSEKMSSQVYRVMFVLGMAWVSFAKIWEHTSSS